jgi:hypothetical protein
MRRNSASRNGEPFDALIAKKQRLPNWKERWCTQYLKVVPLFALAEFLGFTAGQYSEVIGLRDDEGMRILRGLENAEARGRKVSYPLARAKVRKADVMAFWKEQSFDLGLEPWEGNCDLCFMKGKNIRRRILQDDLSRGIWWSDNEARHGGFFDRRYRTFDLMDDVRRQPTIFSAIDDEEYDAECGLHCGVDA